MSAVSFQENFTFSRNFIKIFQQIYQLISEYHSNFLKMNYTQRRTKKIIRGGSGRCSITENANSTFELLI